MRWETDVCLNDDVLFFFFFAPRSPKSRRKDDIGICDGVSFADVVLARYWRLDELSCMMMTRIRSGCTSAMVRLCSHAIESNYRKKKKKKKQKKERELTVWFLLCRKRIYCFGICRQSSTELLIVQIWSYMSLIWMPCRRLTGGMWYIFRISRLSFWLKFCCRWFITRHNIICSRENSVLFWIELINLFWKFIFYDIYSTIFLDHESAIVFGSRHLTDIDVHIINHSELEFWNSQRLIRLVSLIIIWARNVHILDDLMAIKLRRFGFSIHVWTNLDCRSSFIWLAIVLEFAGNNHYAGAKEYHWPQTYPNQHHFNTWFWSQFTDYSIIAHYSELGKSCAIWYRMYRDTCKKKWGYVDFNLTYRWSFLCEVKKDTVQTDLATIA